MKTEGTYLIREREEGREGRREGERKEAVREERRRRREHQQLSPYLMLFGLRQTVYCFQPCFESLVKLTFQLGMTIVLSLVTDRSKSCGV